MKTETKNRLRYWLCFEWLKKFNDYETFQEFPFVRKHYDSTQPLGDVDDKYVVIDGDDYFTGEKTHVEGFLIVSHFDPSNNPFVKKNCIVLFDPKTEVFTIQIVRHCRGVNCGYSVFSFNGGKFTTFGGHASYSFTMSELNRVGRLIEKLGWFDRKEKE